jgi:pre-rRNA-processing protein TSR3
LSSDPPALPAALARGADHADQVHAIAYELLVDRDEQAHKCTILPLAYRPDFAIRRFHMKAALPPLRSELLLHMDGESLDLLVPVLRRERDERAALASDARAPAVGSLALIDCVWKRCGRILDLIEKPLPRLARIPEGFLTAYPRRNKQNLDPADGLATIEALFIAAAFLGVWDESLLKEYHFGARFLELNTPVFARYGLVAPVGAPSERE